MYIRQKIPSIRLKLVLKICISSYFVSPLSKICTSHIVTNLMVITLTVIFEFEIDLYLNYQNNIHTWNSSIGSIGSKRCMFISIKFVRCLCRCTNNHNILTQTKDFKDDTCLFLMSLPNQIQDRILFRNSSRSFKKYFFFC